MTTLAPPLRPALPNGRRLVAAAGGAATLLVATALLRGLIRGAPLPGGPPPWLALHLATVVPAMPLGAWLLVRRIKGDRTHRLLGRGWAVLMMVGAASSFGVMGMTGHLSPIHLLSVLVLVGVPRAILAAMRGDLAAHRRGMTIMAASTIAAALFTFLPGRMLAEWLLG